MLKKKLISLTAALLATVQVVTQTGVSVFASSLDNNYHVQSSDVNETVSRKCSGASEVQTLEYTLEDVEFDNSEAESLYLQGYSKRCQYLEVLVHFFKTVITISTYYNVVTKVNIH